MTHDQENERNEAWLRLLLDGLVNSNSAAEAMAQKLYEFAHRQGDARISAREIGDLIEKNCRAVEGWPVTIDGIDDAAIAIYARI